jgi:hypothetical protein
VLFKIAVVVLSIRLVGMLLISNKVFFYSVILPSILLDCFLVVMITRAFLFFLSHVVLLNLMILSVFFVNLIVHWLILLNLRLCNEGGNRLLSS